MICADVSSTIVHGPQNISTFRHSTVNFSCTSDGPADYIYWKYAVDSSKATVYIFSRHGRNKEQFGERFVRSVHGLNSTLTIRNVQASDTGIYSCLERATSRQRSARLTVNGK